MSGSRLEAEDNSPGRIGLPGKLVVLREGERHETRFKVTLGSSRDELRQTADMILKWTKSISEQWPAGEFERLWRLLSPKLLAATTIAPTTEITVNMTEPK